MSQSGWTVHDMPDQTGTLAVITGANSGIGYETARALAAGNAAVVMACRSTAKAQIAAEAIRRETPEARLEIRELDLGSLASIRRFAAHIVRDFPMLDLLINNAGVMVPPYGTTEDGYEQQIGVNHLGHFALTGLLLDTLLAAPAARVVTVSSTMHYMGRIDFDDLHAQSGYGARRAYAQSKLANLLFTLELDRRLRHAQVPAIAVAAHPGTVPTDLQRHSSLYGRVANWLGQNQEMGALPTLYAATASDVRGNDYIGPTGFLGQRGPPGKVGRSAAARDGETAKRLWEISVAETGVEYGALAPAVPTSP